MATLKFKTSLNCSNCVAKVTDILDKLVGAGNWTVDVAVPSKILTVETDTVAADEIIGVLQGFGYQAERID